MAKADLIPKGLEAIVERVGNSLSTDDVDVYGRLKEIENETFRLRTVLAAWKTQQSQDRKMREKYARWRMVLMSAQMVVINIVFILIGCGLLDFEEWTANTFIMAVFSEIAALVVIIVKFLFTRPDDTLLNLIDRPRQRG